MPIAAENRGRYPANWGSEIRPRVLRRAGLRCECEGECGRGHRARCPERHLQPSIWGRRGHTIVLTVAHLTHTPEEVDLELLRAMCQGCHLHYDIDHHRQSELERRQRALEQAGQASLFDPTEAPGGHAPLLPAARAGSTVVGEVAGGACDLSRYSLDQLPPEVRLGVVAAIELHADALAWLAEARRTLGAALAQARSHGGQVNELAAAAGISRPRLYRLEQLAATAVPA